MLPIMNESAQSARRCRDRKRVVNLGSIVGGPNCQ